MKKLGEEDKYEKLTLMDTQTVTKKLGWIDR